MNAGQIYSTLARLERDGLIVGQDDLSDSRGKRVYTLTDAGRAALSEWIETPVPGTRLKDEFFMKLVLVAGVGLAEPRKLLEGQRREYLQSLRDLDDLLETRAKSARRRAACGRRDPSSQGGSRMARPDRAAYPGGPIPMTNVIESKGISKEYGTGASQVSALRSVDLAVERGAFVAIMGPSGCGKSTLLNVLAGLDRPTAGEVWLDGERIDELSEADLARTSPA